MFYKLKKKYKANAVLFKYLLFASTLTFSLIYKSDVISKSLKNAIPDIESRDYQTSFITKAVKKTGAAVVTIDTQKYVKRERYSRDSRIFLDPYFERLFGYF